ncbi:MAG: metallophosphoesterase family protein [ANME-2 cluster archaeon]|nr:metallophosphoesterase family protein [ANME-2 cluster archaeon]
MKLLALSDLHGDFSKVQALIDHAGEIDGILISGDITHFGPDETARGLIDMFDVPVLAIPGNCDLPGILEVLDSSHAINLHKNCYSMDDVCFMGLGGSNSTPFNTPFELTDEDMEQTLDDMLTSCSGIRNILLSHAPPFGYVDELPVGHVGSHAIAKFLSHFDLIVCGHIHEARGLAMSGNTTMVNVGEASHGYGALIFLNDTISVELIEV